MQPGTYVGFDYGSSPLTGDGCGCCGFSSVDSGDGYGDSSTGYGNGNGFSRSGSREGGDFEENHNVIGPVLPQELLALLMLPAYIRGVE